MPVARRPHRIHKPDLSRIPSALQGCEWVPQRNHDELYNGQVLLAAVPVCNRSDQPDGGWKYEFDVVRIRCDEDWFAVETMAGDTWGWEIDDVDFYAYIQK